MSAAFRGALLTGALLFCCAPAFPETFRFNPDLAYELLKAQCGLGTREPGSAGHARCKQWLDSIMKSGKGSYWRTDFDWRDTIRGKTLKLTNFHLLFNPASKKPRILLCAHWDTRPWADRDPDPLKRNMPVPGANDGASGVAVLLELCRIMSEKPPDRPVEILLFDCEDYGINNNNQWFVGSRRFAKTARPSNYAFAVLVDMVGDKDLRILQEWHSKTRAPLLTRRIFALAKTLGLSAFTDAEGPAVLDDHIALLDIGIPAIDLIDFDYPYWHTVSDTPDKCSAESLSQTGRLLEALVYEP